MQIKLKTTLAGPEYSGSAGKIIDVPKAMGYDLIEGNYAVQVGAEKTKRKTRKKKKVEADFVDESKAETTAVQPTETAEAAANKKHFWQT